MRSFVLAGDREVAFGQAPRSQSEPSWPPKQESHPGSYDVLPSMHEVGPRNYRSREVISQKFALRFSGEHSA
ncbi:hypothetical protein Q31a_33420 [Aureliella helgolandensis]|uniref:Uncharacterized protein n=1 Tax=Aureliella helgolandensis TaxID=2527968 RepID=A0A518G8W6_9BACT|nr:hypothetical protein Q31a_33420 [Aureliella helgolandensis]